MLESERVFDAVWNRLRGDATLVALLPAGPNGIIREYAPPATALPYVLVSVAAVVDALTEIGGARLWADVLVLTKVIGRGANSHSTVRAIGDRIDLLLQNHQVIVGGVEVVMLRREALIPQPPDVDPAGVVYPMLNVTWRSEAYAA